MAVLDKLNVVPTYIFKVPSSGEEIKFRPFLHKEEKVVQMARETGEVKSFIRAVKDIIKACSYDEFDVNTAASFDIEEFFLRIREVSVGETVSLNLVCQNTVTKELKDGSTKEEICRGSNDIKMDLSKVKIDTSKLNKDKLIVKLSDEVSVELMYPGIETLQIIGQMRHDDQTVDITDIICSCVKSIFTDEEVYLAKELAKGELKNFINNLTSPQVEKMIEVVLDVPTIEYKVSEKCKKCGQKIELEFKGLYDFFE